MSLFVYVVGNNYAPMQLALALACILPELFG